MNSLVETDVDSEESVSLEADLENVQVVSKERYRKVLRVLQRTGDRRPNINHSEVSYQTCEKFIRTKERERFSFGKYCRRSYKLDV